MSRRFLCDNQIETIEKRMKEFFFRRRRRSLVMRGKRAKQLKLIAFLRLTSEMTTTRRKETNKEKEWRQEKKSN